MTICNLERMFAPRTIAVVGASEKNESIGAAVMKNLIADGFAGRIFPVHPEYSRIWERNYRSAAMAWDVTEVLRLTGFSEKTRKSLAQYYARLPDTGRIKVHQLQTDLVRRSRNKKIHGKESEFFYAQFLVALHCLRRMETVAGINRKGGLKEEEIEKMNFVRKEIIGEIKRKPALVKNLIDEKFYDLIGSFRKKGVSWRDISKYISPHHKCKISHAHLRNCFDQITSERMNRV